MLKVKSAQLSSDIIVRGILPSSQPPRTRISMRMMINQISHSSLADGEQIDINEAVQCFSYLS